MATNNSINVPTGASGTVLQGQGVGTAPNFSTATYPSTAGTSGKVLISNGTNIVSSTPTFPNASATSGKFIQSDGTNWIASTPTLPTTAGTAGKILRSDGTNWVSTTATFPDTAGTSGNVLTSNGTNWSSTAPITNTAATAFTPDLKFGGANTGITYTNLGGSYVRVGSLIYIVVYITLSSKGSATGNATITGLPFTANNICHRALLQLTFDFSFNAYPASTNAVFAYIDKNTSTIGLGANAATVNATAITDTTFQNGTQFQVSGCYFV